jgi:hypothetical protein
MGVDMVPLPEPPAFLPVPLVLELGRISEMLADAFKNPSE